VDLVGWVIFWLYVGVVYEVFLEGWLRVILKTIGICCGFAVKVEGIL